jgi:hypothetical protein
MIEGLCGRAMAGRFVATILTGVALVGAAGPASGSGHPVAFCVIGAGSQTWAFHAGGPITGPTGSYAHGHGGLAGGSVNGVICQVDRVSGAPDRQIVVSVTKLIRHQHAVSRPGNLGNLMTVRVKVKSSTDPKCKVGTRGTVSIYATYNGVHADTVQFSFPRACRRHRHSYSGPGVVALVPP